MNVNNAEGTTDFVNHPQHYTYISRAMHKNGKEDLEKARWYLKR
ncbi:hypothetical protein DD865_02940, partial [Staphylococcus pseudintermedius]